MSQNYVTYYTRRMVDVSEEGDTFQGRRLCVLKYPTMLYRSSVYRTRISKDSELLEVSTIIVLSLLY